jgi:hypothetical protein
MELLSEKNNHTKGMFEGEPKEGINSLTNDEKPPGRGTFGGNPTSYICGPPKTTPARYNPTAFSAPKKFLSSPNAACVLHKSTAHTNLVPLYNPHIGSSIRLIRSWVARQLLSLEAKKGSKMRMGA